MEVKINREIRNYTESMFFGLSMRQFIFLFSPAAWPWAFILSCALLWGGNPVLDVHFGGGPLCHAGVHHLPRYDGGTIYLAWLRSEMLEPKEFKFEDSNYYYAALKDTIEELQPGRPGKKRRKEPKHLANGRRPSMIKTIKTMSKQEKERYTSPGRCRM